MRKVWVLIMGFLASTVLARAGEFRQCVLNERVVYEIPISKHFPTTVLFPAKIGGLGLSNISSDKDGNAGVLLDFSSGMHFFSVRAKKKGAVAGINVLYNNRNYMLTFYDSEEPCRSIKFIEGRYSSFRNRVNITPSHLINILDKAKMLPLLDNQEGISFEMPKSKTLFKKVEVLLEEVVRFDREDTLVFRIKIFNKTDKDFYYLPQKMAVKVGDSLYYSSISDASGVVPAKGETLAYFAITGRSDGGRENLSVKNEFIILLEECEDVTLVPAGRN